MNMVSPRQPTRNRALGKLAFSKRGGMGAGRTSPKAA